MAHNIWQPTGKPLGPPPKKIQSVFDTPSDDSKPIPLEDIIRENIQDPAFRVSFKHAELMNEIARFFNEHVEEEFFNAFCASCDLSLEDIARVFGKWLGGDTSLRTLVTMADVLGLSVDVTFKRGAHDTTRSK